MKEKKIRFEERTPLGTIIFRGQEYDSITHFFPEGEWRRMVDHWGRTGYVIGYRDWVQSDVYFGGSRSRQGFGGQVMVLYDDMQFEGFEPVKGYVSGLEPCMVQKL